MTDDQLINLFFTTVNAIRQAREGTPFDVLAGAPVNEADAARAVNLLHHVAGILGVEVDIMRAARLAYRATTSV